MPPSSRGIWRKIQGLRRCSQFLASRNFSATSHALATEAPIKIRLRNYQEECIQAVLTHLNDGHKRLGVSLATGSGKTVIFTQLIDRVQARDGVADQTLILAHRQELVEQAAKHCSNAYPSKTVEIEMGKMHSSGFADITIASIQSLISGDRIGKFDPRRFKLVLVDEAHHIVAPGYMRTLEHFGLSEAQQDSPALVGVSATLSRFDGIKLGAAIDQIVYHKDYIDMIEEKWLSDVIFTTVHSKADISTVSRGANGDFQPSELSQVINTEHINEITVRSWLAKAQGRESTLVFCVDVAHIVGLTNTFRLHGIDARFVTGDTPKKERSARLDAFRNKEFPVLVNCGVFTEGTDVPNIDCVLLARPTKSRNLLVQMIGRGMRLHAGKKDCHVIDMVASLETGIVCTPTLFGLDPSEMLDGACMDDVKTLQERKEAEESRTREAEASLKVKGDTSAPKTVTFTDYDSVFDLIEDTTGEKHVRSISPNAWVTVSEDRYILNSNGPYLKIERTPSEKTGEKEYVVFEILVLPPQFSTSKVPYKKPRVIARALTFPDAIHAADTYALKKFPHRLISKNVPWRNLPATEGQLAFINKLRLKTEQLTAADLKKGKAVDMITKLKHGARGRFASLEADRRRHGRAQLKVEQDQALRDREKVSVGPLLN